MDNLIQSEANNIFFGIGIALVVLALAILYNKLHDIKWLERFIAFVMRRPPQL